MDLTDAQWAFLEPQFVRSGGKMGEADRGKIRVPPTNLELIKAF